MKKLSKTIKFFTMKNTTIRQIKRVKTPEGIGELYEVDIDNAEYLVRIQKDQSTIIVMVKMEDIVELPATD